MQGEAWLEEGLAFSRSYIHINNRGISLHRKLLVSLNLQNTEDVCFVCCAGQSWAEPGGLVSPTARACGAPGCQPQSVINPLLSSLVSHALVATQKQKQHSLTWSRWRVREEKGWIKPELDPRGWFHW